MRYEKTPRENTRGFLGNWSRSLLWAGFSQQLLDELF